MFKIKVSLSLLITSLVLCSAQPTRAQSRLSAESATPDHQTEVELLRELLSEVRQLRLTLQQSSIRQHRSMLILDRLRREQDLVDTYDIDLDDLRAQIVELTAEGRYDEELDEIKDTETAINGTDDAKERADLLQEQARLKRALERKKKMDGEQLERYRERERDIVKKLQTERAALADLRYQLDIFEREMDEQIANAERQQAKNDSHKP